MVLPGTLRDAIRCTVFLSFDNEENSDAKERLKGCGFDENRLTEI